MKLVQRFPGKPSRSYLEVVFPRDVPVELPADFPEHEVANLLSWGWEVVQEYGVFPTPNLRPKDGDPDTTPILVDSKTEPPVVHEEIKTEPPPPVAEHKTEKPLEFHRNPAVVNRKK